MRDFITILLFQAIILSHLFAQNVVDKDSEGNLFLLHNDGKKHTTLLYLSCTGGKEEDIDTARVVFDSLNWNIAVCAKSKNHRDFALNENDILNLVDELKNFPQVDGNSIVMYGFSGQGAQALGTALKFPLKFAGVITQCAHHGGIQNPDWQNAAGLAVLLVTRENDWNRQSNEKMAQIFRQYELNVKLVITEGKHGIGDAKELLEDCKMMEKMLSDN